MKKSLDEIERMFRQCETGLYYKDEKTPVKEGDLVKIDKQNGIWQVVYMPRRACFGLRLVEVSPEGNIIQSSPAVNALLSIIPTSLGLTDPEINLTKINPNEDI